MTKLIFACDMSTDLAGSTVMDKIAPHIDVVKVGLEAMTAETKYGGTLADAFTTRAHDMCGKEVMWDMKLHDVANTMRSAARNIVAKQGVTLFTIHAAVSDAALEAVAEEAADKATALAVTVLTDLDDAACRSRFHMESAEAVRAFANNAYRLGIRGFVCSAREAKILRDRFGKDVTIVTPGIRPQWAVSADEQKRVTTPAQAVYAGADYVVVGRPIYSPPLSHTETSAARAIQEELAAA